MSRPLDTGVRAKLGKQPFVPSEQDFRLKDLLAVPLPAVPIYRFGHGTIFSDWKMLGNDRAGDCVFAGGDHETMLYNKLAGRTVSVGAREALADYAAVTGYDPNTGANDNGTVVRDAMSYRRRTGLLDAGGNRHKIDAYVQIDAGDWNLMLRCVWAFGAVGIGFNFPSSAWEQFDSGAVWDVVSGASIDGGHYVPMVGSMSPAKRATFITWGKRAEMTKAFYEKYNDEAWVPLSKEQLRSTGFNYRHVDWATLSAWLAAL